jgi:hypothetical protein
MSAARTLGQDSLDSPASGPFDVRDLQHQRIFNFIGFHSLMGSPYVRRAFETRRSFTQVNEPESSLNV